MTDRPRQVSAPLARPVIQSEQASLAEIRRRVTEIEAALYREEHEYAAILRLHASFLDRLGRELDRNLRKEFTSYYLQSADLEARETRAVMRAQPKRGGRGK